MLCIYVATCDPPCVNGQCLAIDICQCDAGWTGGHCNNGRHSWGKIIFTYRTIIFLAICSSCVQGACISPDTCECDNNWTGPTCDNRNLLFLVFSNDLSNTLAVCTPGCAQGRCLSPNNCTCNDGWTGSICDIGIIIQL